MSIADKLREQRRLVILQALQEDNNRTLSDSALGIVLRHLAHAVSRDVLRAELAWLEQQSLIRVQKLDAEDMWIAVLRREGQEVVDGIPHPGIMRPDAR